MSHEPWIGKRRSVAARAPYVMLGFAVIFGIAMFTPLARFVVYLFPAAAVLVSLYLLRISKSAYVEFVCWLYMLTPFVRRVVDFKTGDPETTLILAPYLATAVCAVALFARWRQSLSGDIAPFVYVIGTILYGCMTTVIHMAIGGLIQGIVAWMSPVFFCLFLYLERDQLKDIYAAFERAMVYGTLLLGAYGVLQYFILPDWDRVWMEIAQIVTIGPAEALEVRVFSTMNAPQVLGAFLVVGILVAFRSRRKLKLLAVPCGVLSLALSMSRSAWLAMVAAVLYLCWRLPNRERTRLVITVVSSTAVMLGSLQLDPISSTLAPRFASLMDVKNDDSANDRTDTYGSAFQALAKSPFGLGVGVETDGSNAVSDDVHDSSIINMLFSFGILGSLTFSFGFLLFVSRILFVKTARRAADVVALQAAVVALVAEVTVNNILTGPNAFLTWCVMGLGYASLQAHREKVYVPQPAGAFIESHAGGIS